VRSSRVDPRRRRLTGAVLVIVSSELRYGAAKKGSLRLSTQLEAVLDVLEVLSFEAPADAAYGALRARLEQAGRPIGGNDLLIAAQAIALGYTVVTDNERAFCKIEDLPQENWLREA
jgi:tRNA(fMet)-specific endonuclease VapC